MTQFFIKPKAYKPKQEKVNTYQEIPKKSKSEWQQFIERRLNKMGLKKIK